MDIKHLPMMSEVWCPEFWLTCSRKSPTQRSWNLSKHGYLSWHVSNHPYVCTYRRTSLQMWCKYRISLLSCRYPKDSTYCLSQRNSC